MRNQRTKPAGNKAFGSVPFLQQDPSFSPTEWHQLVGISFMVSAVWESLLESACGISCYTELIGICLWYQLFGRAYWNLFMVSTSWTELLGIC